MQATFTPYADKSKARTGLVRKFKQLTPAEADKFLHQLEGKWGFTVDDNGPVLAFVAPQADAPKAPAKPRPKKGMTAAEADAKHKAALDKVLQNKESQAPIETPPERTPNPEIEDGKPQSPAPFAAAKVAEARAADPVLAAALENPDDETPPAPDAFSRFAFGQLTAPANKAPEPARPVATAKVQRDRSEQNGVKHPSEGTLCDQVWVIAQNLSGFIAEGKAVDHSKVATLSQVVKAAEAAGINKYTARTQYARWRTFNGITGRLQTL